MAYNPTKKMDVTGPVQPNDIVMRASEIGQSMPGIGALAYKQARKGAQKGIKGIHMIPDTTNQNMDFMGIAKQNVNSQLTRMANTVEAASAPPGHMLAFITPEEAGVLKLLGGSGEMTSAGIPAFPDYGGDKGFGPGEGGGALGGDSKGSGYGGTSYGGGDGNKMSQETKDALAALAETDVTNTDTEVSKTRLADERERQMFAQRMKEEADDPDNIKYTDTLALFDALKDKNIDPNAVSLKNFTTGPFAQKNVVMHEGQRIGQFGNMPGFGFGGLLGMLGVDMRNLQLRDSVFGEPDRGGRADERRYVNQMIENEQGGGEGDGDSSNEGESNYLDANEYYLPEDYTSFRINEGDRVPGRRRFLLKKDGTKLPEGESYSIEDILDYAMSGGYNLLEPFSEYQTRRRQFYGDPDFGQGTEFDYSGSTGGTGD